MKSLRMKYILYSFIFVLLLNGVSAACVDLDDPATYDGKVVSTQYSYTIKDDVKLCPKTYDLGENKYIRVHDWYVDLDCNGATLTRESTLQGVPALVYVGKGGAWAPTAPQIKVKNCVIRDCNVGISVLTSNLNSVVDNDISNCNWGIMVRGGSFNQIRDNNLHDNLKDGIYMGSSSNNWPGTLNMVFRNNIVGNLRYGIMVDDVDNNVFYDNFLDNAANAYDVSSSTWSNAILAGLNIIGGPFLGGNYWSDYAGVDAGNDGIGDTPYAIPGGSNVDEHPLMYLTVVDEDGDGYNEDEDCNDNDASVNPSASEVCNGKDDNCDGAVDEGFVDTDADGVADCVDPDDDGDGVLDEDDRCAFSSIDDVELKPNKYADVDGDAVFETAEGDSEFSMTDTFGCSCEQILQFKPGDNGGELMHGCTAGTMSVWIGQKAWAK